VTTPTSAPAKPAQPQAGKVEKEDSSEPDADVFDFTKIPALLDERYLQLDTDSALRPTIIKLTTDAWTHRPALGLLHPRPKPGQTPPTNMVGVEQQKTFKNAAFDLLDALSRSGSLVIEDCALHVVIAATHRFKKSLIDTLVQDNINPIEKLERSILIVSETIHGLPPAALIKKDQLERVQTFSPNLFTA
jgi:hypothetical protein